MLGIRAPDGTVNMGTETQQHSNATAASAATAAATGAGTSIPPLPPSIVARPKFSRFKQISSRLLAYVDGVGGGAGALEGIEFPSPLMAQRAPPNISSPPLRNQHSNGPAAAAASSSFAAAAAASSSTSAGKTTCPYGFRVKDGACKFADWTSFKLKGEDTTLAGGLAKALPKPEIIGVFFPMLAVLVPRWLSIVAGKNARRGIMHDNQNKKILYLISGAGTPWNTEHDASGNSTKGVAKLATIFLNQFYPDVEVQILHSGVEIFHYDANVQFVNKELKPRIEEVRRILADKYADKWSKFMHLATTLTDGASARISAINASLRHLKPDCLHMWQLKSFWHEYPLISGTRENDVEFHEFEKLEMTPPTLVSETDNWVRMLVKEMIAHKEEFERVRDGDRDRAPNELDSFWLRKSKQPVLSVLMVKKKNKGVKFFRGINVEVSMPTGSLCSERNAIGSALSSDPSLCRKDLRMIAVLALGLEPHSTTSTLSAGMPVPKELIPIAPTTAYGMHASPTRGPISPKLGRYPSIPAAAAFQAAQQATAAADVEVSIDTSAVDSAMHDTELPHSAGRPPLQRATSERSIFNQRKGSISGASGGSGAAPPTSPALKGKSGSSLNVPASTTSPRVSPVVSPLKPPQPAFASMQDDDAVTMAAPASTTVTPRKRKGSTAAISNAVIAPSPVGTGSVSFAAAAAASTHSPAMSPSSSTPPIHSPRFARNNTVPAQPAAVAAAAGSHAAPPHAARDISAQLSRSALANQSPSPAAGSPLSPQRSMQTRGNGIAAAAAAKEQQQPEETRDKKRAKRSPSVTGAAAAAAAAAASAAASFADASSSASASCTPPGHASDSVYASGVVDAEMHRAYLAHELSLVAHRDALHLPPSEVAKLSGNHAPNATTPVERYGAEDLLHASGIGGTAMVHSASLGSVGASSAAASKLVVDERNPINPCGSCNEWLKKIAEVNPEFKVITFTATDCSTCFVKAVKF